MTIDYATAHTLKNQLWRVSQQVSYTIPPGLLFPYTSNPVNNTTADSSTGVYIWKKTGGSNGFWDTMIYSNTGYTAGSVTWVNVGDTATSYPVLMIGITDTPAASPNYPNVKFGISMYSSTGPGTGVAEVYNAGSSGGGIAGGYSSADLWKFVWTSTGGSGFGTVTFYKNGVAVKGPYNRSNTNAMSFCCAFNGLNGRAKVTQFASA